MKRIMFIFSLILMLGVCVNTQAQQYEGRCVAIVYNYDPDTELVYMFSGFKNAGYLQSLFISYYGEWLCDRF